jgi:Ca2+/Na+ antiporter
LTPFDTGEELSKGNLAVGHVVGSIFIGIGVAIGLVIGLGLN